jgi:hypothetical protein
MPSIKVTESIKTTIKDYGRLVSNKSISNHIAFLADIGEAFKKIDGSDFDIEILRSMEKTLNKIVDDFESERHSEKEIEQEVLSALEDLVDLNVALIRGFKKDLDVSEDWNKRLRKYIKILRNISVFALIVTSNKFFEEKHSLQKNTVNKIFDLHCKN